MLTRENYTPFIVVAFVLTIAILVSFQAYILHEPARIASDIEHDRSVSVSEGQTLFSTYCIGCHGNNGEGLNAPPLNDKQFLSETGDQTIFSIISSGVPNTKMPAWNQAHGGPFTDQQVSQLVAFVRNWEAQAPTRSTGSLQGNPSEGLKIFDSTCVVCHGENGKGTERAPALNNPARLSQFDDNWYVNTIANGRLAKGMPTWGTVLSPIQIYDLVALLRAWQRNENVSLPNP